LIALMDNVKWQGKAVILVHIGFSLHHQPHHYQYLPLLHLQRRGLLG
jgi:hypothetical protein